MEEAKMKTQQRNSQLVMSTCSSQLVHEYELKLLFKYGTANLQQIRMAELQSK
jgi:hypothetical protein